MCINERNSTLDPKIQMPKVGLIKLWKRKHVKTFFETIENIDSADLLLISSTYAILFLVAINQKNDQEFRMHLI